MYMIHLFKFIYNIKKENTIHQYVKSKKKYRTSKEYFRGNIRKIKRQNTRVPCLGVDFPGKIKGPGNDLSGKHASELRAAIFIKTRLLPWRCAYNVNMQEIIYWYTTKLNLFCIISKTTVSFIYNVIIYSDML